MTFINFLTTEAGKDIQTGMCRPNSAAGCTEAYRTNGLVRTQSWRLENMKQGNWYSMVTRF